MSAFAYNSLGEYEKVDLRAVMREMRVCFGAEAHDIEPEQCVSFLGAAQALPVGIVRGAVYCIASASQNTCKIGYSEDPQRRLRELQTAHAHELVMVSHLGLDRGYEQLFHHLYAPYRLHGEWFDDSFGVSGHFAGMVEIMISGEWE